MKKILIFIICSMLLICFFAGCEEDKKEKHIEYWTWNLSANEWTNITFTDEIITCIGNDTPEELFSSIINTCGKLYIFQEDSNGILQSWKSETTTNELQHILIDIPCHVQIENTSILKIQKC